MYGGGSIFDPLALTDQVRTGQDVFVGGKTVRSPALNSGEATGIFITAGQSNAANFCDTPYTPTHSTKVDNLHVFDGGMYAAVDPLLGCTNTFGNWGGRFADKLITAGKYARVILVPVAVGGTSISQWTTGGYLNGLIGAAFQRCKALGLPVNAVLWQQGETDGQLGTAQATYQAALSALISQQSAAGFTAPWLLAKSTYISGVSNSTIRAALAALVNGTTIFAGPDTDTLTGLTNRQSDLTHMNATGCDAAAGLWESAWIATGL